MDDHLQSRSQNMKICRFRCLLTSEIRKKLPVAFLEDAHQRNHDVTLLD